MTTPLLPCPVCGEKPEDLQKSRSINGKQGVLYYWVECPGTPPCSTGPCHSTPEGAAVGWNKNNSIKRLPAAVANDIELKNHARRLANLSLLRIKVRTCTICGELFESVGNRTCGCGIKRT